MIIVNRRPWSLLLGLIVAPWPAFAGHHGHHSQGGGGGLGYYGVPYYYPAAVFFPPPVYLVPGPGLAGPSTPPAFPGNRPAMMPMSSPALPAAPARKDDPAKAERMVELGDHLFRVGNISRATERYQQAARADASTATPYVRLAQIALVRGKFAEAADAFREAEIVQPGWLATARDIQALYAEPADFARQVARLESHLQAHPDDRDAWFVLGANWYLSGRVRKASDVFLRLADRQPDSALEAFLAASMPNRPAARR